MERANLARQDRGSAQHFFSFSSARFSIPLNSKRLGGAASCAIIPTKAGPTGALTVCVRSERRAFSMTATIQLAAPTAGLPPGSEKAGANYTNCQTGFATLFADAKIGGNPTQSVSLQETEILVPEKGAKKAAGKNDQSDPVENEEKHAGSEPADALASALSLPLQMAHPEVSSASAGPSQGGSTDPAPSAGLPLESSAGTKSSYVGTALPIATGVNPDGKPTIAANQTQQAKLEPALAEEGVRNAPANGTDESTQTQPFPDVASGRNVHPDSSTAQRKIALQTEVPLAPELGNGGKAGLDPEQAPEPATDFLCSVSTTGVAQVHMVSPPAVVQGTMASTATRIADPDTARAVQSAAVGTASDHASSAHLRVISGHEAGSLDQRPPSAENLPAPKPIALVGDPILPSVEPGPPHSPRTVETTGSKESSRTKPVLPTAETGAIGLSATVAAPPAPNPPSSSLAGPLTASLPTDPTDGKAPPAERASQGESNISRVFDREALPATGQVHDARLLTRAQQAEMHIGLQTTAFGSVEVHAVVRDSHVGLTIGSERGDLYGMLTHEVPHISGRLEQHDLHLDAVRVLDQGLTFHAGSNNADSQSRFFGSPRFSTPGGMRTREPTRFLPEQDSTIETRTGLNVHA